MLRTGSWGLKSSRHDMNDPYMTFCRCPGLAPTRACKVEKLHKHAISTSAFINPPITAVFHFVEVDADTPNSEDTVLISPSLPECLQSSGCTKERTCPTRFIASLTGKPGRHCPSLLSDQSRACTLPQGRRCGCLSQLHHSSCHCSFPCLLFDSRADGGLLLNCLRF
jgi:hypothetical protein